MPAEHLRRHLRRRCAAVLHRRPLPQHCGSGGVAYNTAQCCPPGSAVNAKGVCKKKPAPRPDGQSVNGNDLRPLPICPPPNTYTHGKCCSPPDMAAGRPPETQSCSIPYRTVIAGPGGACGGGQSNSCCRPENKTSTGLCCPAGQRPGGANAAVCRPIAQPWPGGVAAVGGVCPSKPTCTGNDAEVNGSCCLKSRISADGNVCGARPTPRCTASTHFDGQRCVPDDTPCARGESRDADGICRPRTQGTGCPAGTLERNGVCNDLPQQSGPPVVPLPPIPLPRTSGCPPNSVRQGAQCIVLPPAQPCGRGTHPTPNGCVADTPPPPCADGLLPINGACPQPVKPTGCAPGTHPGIAGCVPDAPPRACPNRSTPIDGACPITP